MNLQEVFKKIEMALTPAQDNAPEVQEEVKVEMATMKLAGGVVVEAESFEAGENVFLVGEDEEKVAAPVGEHELEDGRILVIVEEGVISEIREAGEEAGLKEVPIIFADNLTPEQEKEFIIKDNSSFGEWDWDLLANEWDLQDLEDWGLEIPNLDDEVDELEDGEEIELPQSVQVEPPKEYILIMAEPNSVDWEDLKETLQLKMVRRGGYKKGSGFDAVSLERVLEWSDLKDRINADSSTK